MPDRQKAVSFCDTFFPHFDEKRWEKYVGDVSRVYIGSYFCEGLFLKLSGFSFDGFTRFLEERKAKGTLVVPICRQASLGAAKDVIHLAEKYAIIDEIVVNDVGMLAFIRNSFPAKKVHLGRMFLKNTRDSRSIFPRLGDATSYYSPIYKSLFDEFGFDGIEADTVALEMNFGGVPESVVLGMHTSWTYMTVGRMCAFAGAGHPDKEKFIPDISCRMECMGNPVFYSHQQGTIVKSGKTVYCPALPVDITGVADIREIVTVTEWENSDE